MAVEIEVKAKVKNFEILTSRLQEIGCFLSKPVSQNDYIYNQKGINLEKGNHNTPVLRIREQEGKIFFNLKKDRSNELDCIEKEIEVNNANILKDIIELLGFEKTVEVHKKRQKGNYKNYEICLDEVDGLGSFIEVEKISEENGEKAQNELFTFLKSLGIEDGDRILKGYDTMLWQKNNKKN